MKKVVVSFVMMYSTILFSFSPALASESEKPIFQMAVISDVHIDEGENKEISERKFTNALQDVKHVAPKYKVISIVGDLTNFGMPNEYDSFNRILYKYKVPGAKVFSVIGNHEYFETLKNPGTQVSDRDMQRRFIQKQKVPNIYYDRWINGYHFITLAGEWGFSSLKNEKDPHAVNYAYISEKQYNWFEKTIAQKAETGRPIFVFLHQPITNTVYGSMWNAGFEDRTRLLQILKKYPQAIFFSGHSHYPIEHQESIIDVGMTLVNTGSVFYGFDMVNREMRHMSQGFIVNVFNDRIQLKGRDFSNHTWISERTISLINNRNTKKVPRSN